MNVLLRYLRISLLTLQCTLPISNNKDVCFCVAEPKEIKIMADEQKRPDQVQGQNQEQGGLFGSIRQQAEQRMDEIIDQNAGRIPGGERYKQQAKELAERGLDAAEEEIKRRISEKGSLGGIFGQSQKPEDTGPQQQP